MRSKFHLAHTAALTAFLLTFTMLTFIALPSRDEALEGEADLPDELPDAQSTMTKLALSAVVSWARTFRFLTIAATLLAAATTAVILVVWLLPVNVTLGPLQVTRHDK